MWEEVWREVGEVVRQRIKPPRPRLSASWKRAVERKFANKQVSRYDLTRASERVQYKAEALAYATNLAFLLAARVEVDSLASEPLSEEESVELRDYRTPWERERNERLLTFIAERTVAFRDLLAGGEMAIVRRRFLPSHHGPTPSFWPVLIAEWNGQEQCPPRWRYGRPRSMEQAYRNALAASRPLLREFLEAVRVEVNEAWDKVASTEEEWYSLPREGPIEERLETFAAHEQERDSQLEAEERESDAKRQVYIATLSSEERARVEREGHDAAALLPGVLVRGLGEPPAAFRERVAQAPGWYATWLASLSEEVRQAVEAQRLREEQAWQARLDAFKANLTREMAIMYCVQKLFNTAWSGNEAEREWFMSRPVRHWALPEARGREEIPAVPPGIDVPVSRP